MLGEQLLAWLEKEQSGLSTWPGQQHSGRLVQIGSRTSRQWVVYKGGVESLSSLPKVN